MAKMDWEKAARRDRAGVPLSTPKKPARIPMITNKQAKLLADLQRQAGVPYSGRGMSKREAGQAIDRLLARRAA